MIDTETLELSEHHFESDPNGINQHVKGAKLDEGKPMAGLMMIGFSRALLAVSKVGTYGAKKYSPNGWKHVLSGKERYTDAMCRHLLAEGYEEFDEDSGMLHAAQVAWNALARLELIIQEHDIKQEKKE